MEVTSSAATPDLGAGALESCEVASPASPPPLNDFSCRMLTGKGLTLALCGDQGWDLRHPLRSSHPGSRRRGELLCMTQALPSPSSAAAGLSANEGKLQRNVHFKARKDQPYHLV